MMNNNQPTMSKIDLSKPVWCGGEDISDRIGASHLTYKAWAIVAGKRLEWDFPSGVPLGDHPPLTNVPPENNSIPETSVGNVTGSDGGERPTPFTPPVKPEVVESGEEVKGEIDNKIEPTLNIKFDDNPVKEIVIRCVMVHDYNAALTRIAALEDCVRDLRDAYEKAIHPGNGKAKQELITRAKNLVP
jgi:hypothetical protein